MSPLILILVSFLLTGVLGTFLSTYLQRKTWDHQRDANLSDRELQKADVVCRQVSSLQDKLLYRMVRLYHALRSANNADGRKTATAELKTYDEVLFEWNDQRNVSLALIGAYFGRDGRDLLRQIHEQCQFAEDELDTMRNDVMQDRSPPNHVLSLEQHLNEVNKLAYRLGIFMMVQIRVGKVGRTAPHPVMPQADLEKLAGLPLPLPGGITP